MKSKIINIIRIIIMMLVIILVTMVTSEYSKNHTPISNSEVNLDIDMSRWNYDKKNNVYYQLKVNYCAKPTNEDLQTLGIYVPGDYLNARKNQNDTYTCTINKKGEKAGYTSDSAPIIISINSSEYQAQLSPEEYKYTDIADYINSGYIYIQPGIRGMIENEEDNESKEYSNNIIEGITDLKGVVRFCRYNKGALPGNHERIFSFGTNGGGTKSAILGASGDSDLYYSNLLSIGAIMNDIDGNWISDSVNGAMCCTPTINLEMAEESYMWNIGQYLEKSASNNKIVSYANYINNMNFKSEEGTLLYLNDSVHRKYNDGTYYNYILNKVENALNQFLSETRFPYINKEKEVTYRTPEEYINYLNKDTKWVIKEKDANKIKITSIQDFVSNCKSEKVEEIRNVKLNECNPLYFLSSKYDGEGSAYISRYWNIYSEIDLNNKEFLSEENLKIVLQNNEDVRKVKYTSFWGREYSLQEKEELAIENLKSWIKECY